MSLEQRAGGGPERVDPCLLAALMAAVAAVGAALFALSPLLPDIARDLNVSVAQAGRLPAIYSLALAVAAPLVALSARAWPRPRILSLALSSFGAAWWMPLLAHSFEAMLLVTLIAGASAGAVLPAVYALAADVSPPAQRARVMGRTVAGWSVAILCTAPIIATIGQWFDWRLAFGTLGLCAWAACGLLRLGLARQASRQRVPIIEQPTPSLRDSLLAVLRDRLTIRLLLVNLLDMGAFFSIYAYLGTQLRQANGWGSSLAGFVLACYGIGLALAALNGRLIDHWGSLRCTRYSLLGLVVVLPLLPWLTDRPAAMATGMVIWGAVQGSFFTSVTALSTEQLPALRGVITALLSGSTYLGVALLAPLAGLLFDVHGLWLVGLFSSLACLLGWLILARQ